MAINSILTSVKRSLGLEESYTVFDPDIILLINSSLSVLNQLGVGPEAGYQIEDASATWDSVIGTDRRLNNVKEYVFIDVKLRFDPAATSFLGQALHERKKELEWRINAYKEETIWTNPNPPRFPRDRVLDGGEP